MSAERVLDEMLSGEEIRLAILDKVGESLQKDCFLSPNCAYQSFRATVRIQLEAQDVGRTVEVKTGDVIMQGEIDPDIHLTEADAEFEMESRPPNQVRVESGQPVPVLTKDAEGKETVKKIKYARPAKKQ